MTDITELYIRKFQSTLLQEERRITRYHQKAISEFQSTLLQEERLSDQLKAMDGLEFQSTLLQEERLVMLQFIVD